MYDEMVLPLRRTRRKLKKLYYKYRNERDEKYGRLDFNYRAVLHSKRTAGNATYFAILLLETGDIINCEIHKKYYQEFGLAKVEPSNIVEVSFHRDRSGWVTMKKIRKIDFCRNLDEESRLNEQIQRKCKYVKCNL